jgi:hypothetical protein
MRRFLAGGSAFMSLTSRARRSISSTSTSNDRGRTVVAALQLFDARRNFSVGFHQLAHADEGADDGNTHLEMWLTTFAHKCGDYRYVAVCLTDLPDS